MGKTADLTVVQKTIIDTLHKEGKPQTFIAKEAGCSQSAVSKHVNRKLSGRKKWKKKMHNQRENRSLMRIVKQNQFKNLATVIFRGVLPGIRRRRTGLLPSGPKSSFQMRASFVFHLETKVLESGGRVEKLISSCLKSSVKFPQSVIWGAMSSAGVVPLCFFQNQRHCTRLPRHFGALHVSFC